MYHIYLIRNKQTKQKREHCILEESTNSGDGEEEDGVVSHLVRRIWVLDVGECYNTQQSSWLQCSRMMSTFKYFFADCVIWIFLC